MRGRKPSEATVPTMMRLPKSIRDYLEGRALVNERSLTAEAVYRLRREIDREKASGKGKAS